MLITLGFIALLIGIIVLALGYTAEPRAVRPGWACIVLALVLILIGTFLPRTTTHEPNYDAASVIGGSHANGRP